MDQLQITGADVLLLEVTNGDTLQIAWGVSLAVGGGGAVNSVNGMDGDVVLNAADVGADPAGTATAAIAAALVPYATQTAVAAGDASTLLSAQTYATASTNALATTINGQLANKADLVNGVLATSQIPAQALTQFLNAVNSQAAMLALVGQSGDWCIRTDQGMAYIITAPENTGLLSDWTALPQVASPVTSVNGQTGIIVLSYADVGAEQAGAVAALQAFLQPQIDTKADANAVIAALAGKVSTGRAVNTGTGLTGGGALSADLTLAIANTGVTAGTYGTGLKVPHITINAQGQATAIAEVDITLPGSITWVNVTNMPAALAFGYADNSYPFQIGKDSDGNVYVRGAMRNTGGSSIAAFTDIITVPSTHKFKWFASPTHYLFPSAGAYFHNLASSTSINGANFLTARTNGTTNWLGVSQPIPAGIILVFPEQCIGFLE